MSYYNLNGTWVYTKGYKAYEENLHKFYEFVDVVSDIDIEAGLYILEFNRGMFDISNNLAGLFIWGDTPQGHEYWAKIFMELGGGKYWMDVVEDDV